MMEYLKGILGVVVDIVTLTATIVQAIGKKHKGAIITGALFVIVSVILIVYFCLNWTRVPDVVGDKVFVAVSKLEAKNITYSLSSECDDAIDERIVVQLSEKADCFILKSKPVIVSVADITPTPTSVSTQLSTPTPTPIFTPAPFFTSQPISHVHSWEVDPLVGRYCSECGEVDEKWIAVINLTATPSSSPTVTSTPLPRGYTLMPDLIGLKKLEASEKIHAAGLLQRYSYIPSKENVDLDEYYVAKQDIPAGDLVKLDHYVEIEYVPIDPRIPTIIPDLVGLKRSEAIEIINENCLRYKGEMSKEGLDSDAEKFVGGQSIAPGIEVYPLDEIMLEIVEKDWEDIPLYLDGYTTHEQKTITVREGEKRNFVSILSRMMKLLMLASVKSHREMKEF